MENPTDKIIETLTRLINESDDSEEKHIIFDRINGLRIVIRKRIIEPGVIVDIEEYL